MNIRFITQLLLLLFMLIALPALADDEKADQFSRIVKVSINDSWPDSFLDTHGAPQGLLIDILREIGKKQNWTLVFVMDEWQKGLQQLENSEVDLKVSIAYTSERDLIYDFSKEPVYTDWANVVVNSSDIQSILDLKNRRVAITEQGFFPREFENLCAKFEIKPQFVRYKTDKDVLSAVEKKQVDAGVIPHIFAVLNAQRYNVRISPIVFSPTSVFFASPQDKNSDLLEAIDKHLKAWKSDPKSFYYEIMNKWIYAENVRSIIPRWLAFVIIISAGVIVFLFFWSRLLRYQVRRKTTELRESEEDLKESQRIAHVGSWRLDLATNQVTWSDELYKMYGFDPTLPPPPYTEHQKLFTVESWEQLSVALARTAETGVPYELELKTLRKDGSTGWMWVYGKTILNEKGKSVGLMGAAQDISERKLAELEILKAKEAAEAASKAKSVFLTNMSHELRTPMNGIMGAAQLLELSIHNKPEVDFVALLSRCSKNMIGLIEDLLDLSRISSSKLSLSSIKMSLTEVAENAVSTIRKQAVDKGLTLSILANGLPPHFVLGDPLRIQQILLNLLSNAIKFTDEGSVLLSIDAKKSNDKTDVIFCVKDTGVGIDKEIIPVIFERFVQGDMSYTKRFQGAGLGLTITEELVTLMGGTISVESELGKGSSFIVKIPFTIFEDQEKPVEAETKNEEKQQNLTFNILLAEDNDDNRLFFQLLIKDLYPNASFCSAKNGQEAIEKFAKEEVDIVFMDIQMPVMNGVEATEYIRNNFGDKGKSVPIIAITAYAMESDRECCIAAGMNDFVTKPVDIELLSQLIAKYIVQ